MAPSAIVVFCLLALASAANKHEKIQEEPIVPKVVEKIPDEPIVPKVAAIIPDEPIVPKVAEKIPDEPIVPKVAAIIPDEPIVPKVAAIIPDEPIVPKVAEKIPDEPIVPKNTEKSLGEPSKIDAILSEICTLSQGQSNKKVAPLVAQGIELLKLAPGDAVVGVLDKVRAGQYCADYMKLESLFLDAVAFVGTPGAFKVMEQEIAGGSTTGGRIILYTVAMTPLWPIVEEYKLIITNKGTELIQMVQDIIKDKNINIDTIAKELKKLILLVQNTIKDKNINIESIVLELQKVIQLVQDTLKTNGIDIDIIVVKLKTLIQLVVNTIKEKDINVNTIAVELQKLIQLVQDTIKDKNINIDTIVKELNKLIQLAQNALKDKGINIDAIIVKLKNIIQLVIDTIKDKNINIDTVVVELQKLIQLVQDTIKDKNINIDTIVKKLDEVIQLVLNTIKDKDINIDTIIAEVQKLFQLVIATIKDKNINIDTIVLELKNLIKPILDIMNDKNINIDTIVGELKLLIKPVLDIIKDKNINIDTIVVELTKLIQLVLDTIKEKNINIDTIAVELTKLIQPVLDIIKEKNINNATIKKTVIQLVNTYLNIDIQNLIKSIDLNVKKLVETIIPVISDVILGAKDINIDAARTGQINLDLLIPTITGFPLKIKLTGTAVAGIKIINNLNLNQGNVDALLKIIPSLNTHVEAQIGFGEQLSTGLQLINTVYTTNGFSLSVSQKNGADIELQIELPAKMELFDIKSEVLLIKSGKVLNAMESLPGKVQEIKIVSNECFGIVEPITGLLLCYDMNLPALIPLGKPILLRAYLQKSDAAMNGYRLAAKLRNKTNKKLLMIAAGTYGAATSIESTLKLSYTKGDNTYVIASNIHSSLIKSTAEITIINQPEYKSIQIYGNDQIGTFAPVEGKISIDFKPLTVSNGKIYEVTTYAGLSNALNDNHRLFKIALSILENGDMSTANLITEVLLLPATFEVEVDLPKTAGLLIYKIEKLTVRSSVSSVVVESRIVKKSPEVFQTTLLLLNAGSALINIDAVHTLSVDSPIIGGAANNINLMISINGKILNAEFGYKSKLNYENGVMVLASGVRYFGSEVLAINSRLTFENGAIVLVNGVKSFDSKVFAVNTQLTYANGAIAIINGIEYSDSVALVVKSQLTYENGVILLTNGISYFDSEVLAVISQLTYENGAIILASGIQYFGSEVLAVNSQLTYDSGAIILASGIKYLDSEAVAVNSQLSYKMNGIVLATSVRYFDSEVLTVKLALLAHANGLEASSAITFYDSELLLVNSMLSYTNGIVEFTNVATCLGAPVFTAALQQTLDINNLALKAEIGLPIVKFGILSILKYSNMVIESSNIAIYSGLKVININSKHGFANGIIFISSKITSEYFSRELLYANVEQTVTTLPLNLKVDVTIPSILSVELKQEIDSTALTTEAQVVLPAVIKPLHIKHILGINGAFSYSLLTHVSTGDSVLLHIEGPLSVAISRLLVQLNLDLKISGAFEGTFKILHGITLSLEKIECIVDVRHTLTPIVFINLVLDRSNAKEIALKSIVKLPFVTETEMVATITTSLIHATVNILALPGTPYAHNLKGSSDINLVENVVKSGLYLDDKKIELITKYAVDTTALKIIINGDLMVTTLHFGYKLEAILASPLKWFQGVSGIELSVTLPTKKVAVAKSILDIQLIESELVLKPVIAFITTNENKYELATSVAITKLPIFLNFAITSETTLFTPQLQQITLATSLMHEDKEQSGEIALQISLKESVLSEALSLEYVLKSGPSELLSIIRVMKGSKLASLSTLIHLVSGINAFEITNELSLPIIALATKLTKTAEGSISLALLKNQELMVKVYCSMPLLTSHTVGIEFPSRILEFSAVLTRNQITLKISPEANKSPKAIEIALRLNTGAGKGQLEALVTAPSLSKEMRLAVELELIEAGEGKYDMVSIDVQYQVSEALKLLKATIEELKNVYLDLVKDGISPDLNRWYRKIQKVLKQAPKYLNSLKDELIKSVPKYYELVKTLVPEYYEFVKTYLLDLYHLYEPDIIAMSNTARIELLRYLNIAKTEAPVLFNTYMDILKTTEIWNAVQVTLNELLNNYPAYYDTAIDFYSKVIIPYVSQITDLVGKLLVLPEFDVSQYVAILEQEVTLIVENVVPQILNTKIVQLIQEKVIEIKTLVHDNVMILITVIQEKVIELKTLYPTEFSLLEDVYTSLIVPTSSEVLAIVNKILAIPDLDFPKYLEVIIVDVPNLLNSLSQRILNTQIVKKLVAAYPTIVIDVTSQLLNTEIVKLIQVKVIELKPLIQEKAVELTSLIQQKVIELKTLIQEKIIELKTLYPTEIGLLEDFYANVILPNSSEVLALLEDVYTNVILPTSSEVLAIVNKVLAIPDFDYQKYLAIAKVEAPVIVNHVLQRLLDTQLIKRVRAFLPVIVEGLKTSFPTVVEISEDLYTNVVIPSIEDILGLVGKLTALPVSDLQETVKQNWAIIKAEVPPLLNKITLLLTDTKLVQKLRILYPLILELTEDVYITVLLPTAADIVPVMEHLIRIPLTDYQHILEVIVSDVPILLNTLSQRILGTKIVSKLNTAYPTLFIIVEDIYSNVILLTINDIVVLINKVATLPIDYHEYLAIAKVEVPVLASQLIQRLHVTKLVVELKSVILIIVELSEDLYTNIFIASVEDILVLAEKLIALPVDELQETVKQILAEVPPLLIKIIQRLPDTKLVQILKDTKIVQMLKTLYPVIFALTDDLYTIIIVPTAIDIVKAWEILINIPLADIQVAAEQFLSIVKVEIPALIANLLERLPKTQIYLLIKEKSTELLQLLVGKLDELKAQYPDAVALILEFYSQVAVPAYSDLAIIYGKSVKISDVYDIRDVVVTDVMVFIKHLIENISNTSAIKVVISKLSELLTKLHELLEPFTEYQTVLKMYNEIIEAALDIYNQISLVTLNDIIAPLKSYIVEELGISLTISAEKLTAVVPLPVSVATVRNYYGIITVSAPAYVADVVAQLLPQGHLLYKYIEERALVIVDYITTQAPVYLQYITINLEPLQVMLLQNVEKIQTDLSKYIGDLQSFLLPYIELLKSTAVTYIEIARNSSYMKLIKTKVLEIVDLLMIKLDELLNLYPSEYQAIKDFISLYVNICLDYTNWALNTIVEYPPVKKAIVDIINLTPEKLQSILDMVIELLLSTVSQVQAIVLDLIAAIPKEIPVFIKFHVPAFIITLLS